MRHYIIKSKYHVNIIWVLVKKNNNSYKKLYYKKENKQWVKCGNETPILDIEQLKSYYNYISEYKNIKELINIYPDLMLI